MGCTMARNVCNKNAVAERTLIDKFIVSGAMVHFTFFAHVKIIIFTIQFCLYCLRVHADKLELLLAEHRIFFESGEAEQRHLTEGIA